MKLVLTIAWTHVRRRARQTLVAIAGVTTGVGFSIMMAAIMEGSQDDFIRTLVDALPQISVTDEVREPTQQPAGLAYRAAEFHGLTPEVRRSGIKNPMATIAALQSWVPGTLTPSVQSKAVLRFAGRNLTISMASILAPRPTCPIWPLTCVRDPWHPSIERQMRSCSATGWLAGSARGSIQTSRLPLPKEPP